MIEHPPVRWSGARARVAGRRPRVARGAACVLALAALLASACNGGDGSRASYLTGTGFVADRAGLFEVADPTRLCAAIDPAWATLEPGYLGVEVDTAIDGVYGGVQLTFEAGGYVRWAVAGDPPPSWVNAVVVSGGGRHRVYDYRGAAAAGKSFVTSDGPLHAPPAAGAVPAIEHVGLCVADADETLVWRRQLAQYSRALGVAVGPAGQVAIAGAVEQPFLPGMTPIGAEDVFVAAVGAGGAIAWARQVGTTMDDVALDVAFAPDGGLVVSGSTAGAIEPGALNAGSLDAFVLRLDAAGQVLWVRQRGTPGLDDGRAVAVDALGGVVLLIESAAFDLEDPSLRVVRFGPTGESQGTTVLTVAGASVTGGGIALDAVGNVYVAGGTTGLWGMAQFGCADAFVAKLLPNGDLDWVHQFGSGADDAARAVAVAPDGSLRVAGVTQGTLDIAQPHLGGVDTFLLRIDAEGDPTWLRRIGTLEDDALSIGRHLAVDGDGASVMFGDTRGPMAGFGTHVGEDDVFVVRVDADGDEVWRRQFGTVARDFGDRVALDADGFVWGVGGSEGHFAPDDPDQPGSNAIVVRGWP